MNSSYGTTMYRTLQDAPSQAPMMEGFIEGVLSFWGIYLIVSIIIFVIWIWSMLSMIMLNIRFRDFYEDFRRAQNEASQDDPPESEARRRVNIQPIEEGASDSSSDSPFKLGRGMIIFIAIAIALLITIVAVSLSV